MPLQDLTPQLRTRLNRMERAVGWFILLATVLLVGGFVYYMYSAAENRGWFKAKARYYVYTESADGLVVGSTIKLIGREAGRIVRIEPMPPKWGEHDSNNIYVEFEVLEPYFLYIWTEGSFVQVKQSGFLNSRELDITKGTKGHATYITNGFREDATLSEIRSSPHPEKWHLGKDIWDDTNLIVGAWAGFNSTNMDKLSSLLGSKPFPAIDTTVGGRHITGVWNPQKRAYDKFFGTNIYGLERFEEPAISDRVQAMVNQIQTALPSVLQLTNQIAAVLSNTASVTANLNAITASARPVVSNFSTISAQLTNSAGSLGDWLIPTNINQKLDATLSAADVAITNLNTNLVTLNLTLANLANTTSNLNNQVQSNSNMLSNLDQTVVHSDEFVQGLKRFWLFRHTFATHKTNSPPVRHMEPLTSPKNTER